MRLRILCTVCCLCVYVKFFREAFYTSGYKYAKMFLHGLIYLEGQVNCKRLCEYWKEDVVHQRLVHFLNHGHYGYKCAQSVTCRTVIAVSVPSQSESRRSFP